MYAPQVESAKYTVVFLDPTCSRSSIALFVLNNLGLGTDSHRLGCLQLPRLPHSLYFCPPPLSGRCPIVPGAGICSLWNCRLCVSCTVLVWLCLVCCYGHRAGDPQAGRARGNWPVAQSRMRFLEGLW